MRACLLLGTGAIATAIALALSMSAGAQNLLVNGGFEDEAGGVPSGWSMSAGGTITTAADAQNGDNDGLIVLSSSAAVLFQTIAVEPGSSYTLTGDYLLSIGSVSQSYLRLIVSDADGAAWEQYSNVLTEPGTWSTGLLGTACEAVTIRAEVVVIGAPGTMLYLDDLSLTNVPGQDCSTPTATASATDSPSATPADTATPTQTLTAAPSATATAADALTSTPQQATATPTPTRTPTPPFFTPTPARGVVNGGFEVADGDGHPAGWSSQGGVLSQVEEPLYEGGFAGAYFSGTDSTKWLHQAVEVVPGDWYELAAYVFDDDPWADAAWLRISWYASADGSGSAIDSVDSTDVLDTPVSAYRPLSTGPVQAPPGVHSAQLRIMLRPRSDVGTLIYIDGVSFEPSSQPPTPTPTVTPTPTSTYVPAATPTPTSTRSPQPTATPTPTRASTRTPTSAPLPAPTSATSMPTRTPLAATVPAPSPTSAPPVADGTHGMIANGGFESAGTDGIAGWQNYGGVLAQVSGPVHSGSAAAALYSSSDSTKWAYQIVGVSPESWYELDGFVFDNDPRVESAFLRISWYESTDATGSAIATADSTETLDVPAAEYRYLTTGPVLAPPGAHSSAARILLRPVSADGAIVYIDDVSFRLAAAPVSAPDAPGGSDEPASGGGASGAGSRSPGRNSTVASASRPPAFNPLPTPVIKRDLLAVPIDESGDGPSARWPYAVVALGVLTTTSSGWWTWRQRRSTTV
ncbi:MAG: carbohydrate binding domain-containing protein [Dehalococcoidia bacterium]